MEVVEVVEFVDLKPVRMFKLRFMARKIIGRLV